VDRIGTSSLSEDRKEFFESITAKLPTQCIGTPYDLGEAAAMVMSNPYVTGSVVSIDGGFTI
jgi:NAD(P)-dependent dehydrogenase (short-subunit alcohol dehydrogenase family)